MMKPLLGWHLTVDGRGDPSAWDEALVTKALSEVVALAQMTLWQGPVVRTVDGGRIIGMVLLVESHASIHLDLEKGIAFADLFSCKAFDHLKVRAHIEERLGLRPDSCKSVVFPRGSKTAHG